MPKDKGRQSQTQTRLPETVRAEIIGLRRCGYSYRQIAEKTGRDKNTVMKILKTPDAEQELTASAQEILARYRQRALNLVPEALDALEKLVSKGDRTAVLKLLQGTQVLMPKSEQVVEERKSLPALYPEKSVEELDYFALYERWPSEAELVEYKKRLAEEQ